MSNCPGGGVTGMCLSINVNGELFRRHLLLASGVRGFIVPRNLRDSIPDYEIEYQVLLRVRNEGGCLRNRITSVTPKIHLKRKGTSSDKKKYWLTQFIEALNNPLYNILPASVTYSTSPELAEKTGEFEVRFMRRLALSEPIPPDAERARFRGRVDELALLALMSGYDRIGTSIKIMVAQTFLQKQIFKKFAEKLGLREDTVGALANAVPPLGEDSGLENLLLALLGLARDFLVIKNNIDVLYEVETTAIWFPRYENKARALAHIENLLKQLTAVIETILSDKYPVLSVGCRLIDKVTLDNLYSCLTDEKRLPSLRNILFGRLMGKIEALSRYVVSTGGGKGREFNVVVMDWTEQMGPVDVGLAILSLTAMSGSVDDVYLPERIFFIATPLSLTNAYIGYSRTSDELKKRISVVLGSGSDPLVPQTIARALASAAAGKDVAYFAGGPTYHTLSMTYWLKRELGDRVTVIPPTVLSPSG